MAISKKGSATKESSKVTYNIEVTRAKDLENCIMFDAKVNGVMIYGMSYKELQRKDGSGSFVKIDFPSRKGSDGKYYSHAWFKIEDDMIGDIEKQIESKI